MEDDYNEKRFHGSLKDWSPQQIWDDYYYSVYLLRQPATAKPVVKSRSVVEGSCAMATIALYSLEFSEDVAIFAESRN